MDLERHGPHKVSSKTVSKISEDSLAVSIIPFYPFQFSANTKSPSCCFRQAFCAISTTIFPTTNNKDTIPTPKTNVIAIIPTEHVLIFLSSSKQKARSECAPRARKISFASATRLSQALGPVAFRPLITQGLALSAISVY